MSGSACKGSCARHVRMIVIVLHSNGTAVESPGFLCGQVQRIGFVVLCCKGRRLRLGLQATQPFRVQGLRRVQK